MIIHKLVKHNDTQLNVLSWMSSSTIQFYGTGSRFFSINDHNSDYDFFCSTGPNIEQELKRWGFTKLKADVNVMLYSDRNTVMVYEHKEAEIHVQIVKDVLKKRLAQDIILNTSQLFMELRSARIKDKKAETKRHSRDFWNYVFTIIDSFLNAVEKVK